MKETVLWTNATPTSDFGNSTQNLSGKISDFKYISVRVKTSKTTSNYTDYFFDTTQFVNSYVNSDYPQGFLGHYASSYFSYRMFFWDSDTSTIINNCLRNKSNTAPTQDNSYMIPVSISGWK